MQLDKLLVARDMGLLTPLRDTDVENDEEEEEEETLVGHGTVMGHASGEELVREGKGKGPINLEKLQMNSDKPRRKVKESALEGLGLMHFENVEFSAWDYMLLDTAEEGNTGNLKGKGKGPIKLDELQMVADKSGRQEEEWVAKGIEVIDLDDRDLSETESMYSVDTLATLKM